MTDSAGFDAAGGLMHISDKEFSLIRGLVYERFGINLTEAKKSLVVGRLQRIIRSLGFDTFKQYYSYLSADATGRAMDTLVNRITTNHTFFYRESAHFEFFRDRLLPEISAGAAQGKPRDLRIWCAGCSSGEEPYMLVMLMLEYFGAHYRQWDAGVLATDISTRVLEKAVAGVYTNENLSRLPAFARRHFARIGEDQWALAEDVKREVTFRRLNLMNATFPFKRQFHAIFCRNVMIYFDQATRAALVKKFYNHLMPGGYFFIGHSESLGREQQLYEYIMPAAYRRR